MNLFCSYVQPFQEKSYHDAFQSGPVMDDKLEASAKRETSEKKPDAQKDNRRVDREQLDEHAGKNQVNTLYFYCRVMLTFMKLKFIVDCLISNFRGRS